MNWPSSATKGRKSLTCKSNEHFLITNNKLTFRTSKAMSGSMTFQESLKIRLDIIKPSLQQMKDFIRTKPPNLTPGVK